MIPLPIDPAIPSLVQSLIDHHRLVLSAPPGSGKTTRLPRALLLHGAPFDGEILVLEPRRLPARLAAQRVAAELGEPVGKRVGYTVRFEDVSSRETRLRFVTEGILTRRLLADPSLPGVSVVILDEFHERHLQGDLALALLAAAPRTARRLVLMSATLNETDLAARLDAYAGRAEGRPYEVEQLYLPQAQDLPLANQVLGGIRQVARATEGDILVFLPGAREIRDVLEQCSTLASQLGADFLPLHGDLPAPEQDLAIARRPDGRRKVILSTNIAESSVTIDGVTGVVDSGLARVARVDVWSGLPSLVTEPISRASAIQRAGRAGRTARGVALRLYTKADFDLRREADTPEIERADLTATALEVASITALKPAWLTPPPEAAWQRAQRLLLQLGALDQHGSVTPLGKRMLRLSLHPRLARVACHAEDRNISEDGALAAALLMERDIRREARAFGKGEARASEASDVVMLMDLYFEAEGSNFSANALRAMGLDRGAVHTVERATRSIRAQLGRGRRSENSDASLSPEARERELLRALLLGFPDRVAKRRRDGDFALAGSGTSTLSPASVVRHAPWVVALAAEMGRGKPMIRLASAIEPDWLLDHFDTQVEARVKVTWNADKECAEAVSELVYEGLVLDQSVSKAVTTEESDLLCKMACDKLHVFAPEWPRWVVRVRLAATMDPRVTSLDDEAVRSVLQTACEGKRSFAELRTLPIQDMLTSATPGAGRVFELCPERLTLPSGRQVKIEYDEGKPPYVESYLQDFCGLRDTPKVGGVPLVMHLLAPNKRAVQITTDLASFWRVHYPGIRRELSRKYPRHSWPDDPSVPVPMRQRRPSP
jgi:ATP-dependent helicase HrpB